MKKRRYSVYISPLSVRSTTLYTLYYVDDTRLKEIADEYRLSRSGGDDRLHRQPGGDRPEYAGKRAGAVGRTGGNPAGGLDGSYLGAVEKIRRDHFLVILEERHLRPMIEGRFEILNRVRSVQAGDRVSVTLSIGVGQGETLRESGGNGAPALEWRWGVAAIRPRSKPATALIFMGRLPRSGETHESTYPRGGLRAAGADGGE